MAEKVLPQGSSNKEQPDNDSHSSDEKKSPLLEFYKELKDSLRDSSAEETQCVLEATNLESVAKLIKCGQVQNVVVMTGAGISTSAGIPDFRSPKTGVYASLAKYNLPDPQAVFHIDYFKQHPEPFFTLSKSLFPKQLKPTPCHYFIRLLHDKGLLLRTFTQNIDSLEHIAGVPAEKIVEAHGSHHTSTCMDCKKPYDMEWMRGKLLSDAKVPRCDDCSGVVKPDVVFFGENLPSRFFTTAMSDLPRCDLLLIMGTSLVVQPFCSLVTQVGNSVPRVLINNQKVGQVSHMERILGLSGLDFDSEDNKRDVFWEGTCDDGCSEFAKLLGWETEFKQLISREWKTLDEVQAKENATKAEQSKATNWPPDQDVPDQSQI